MACTLPVKAVTYVLTTHHNAWYILELHRTARYSLVLPSTVWCSPLLPRRLGFLAFTLTATWGLACSTTKAACAALPVLRARWKRQEELSIQQTDPSYPTLCASGGTQ